MVLDSGLPGRIVRGLKKGQNQGKPITMIAVMRSLPIRKRKDLGTDSLPSKEATSLGVLVAKREDDLLWR